jgi:hypothetical protein
LTEKLLPARLAAEGDCMSTSSPRIDDTPDTKAVIRWFDELVTANAHLLEEANRLVFTACDGKEVTPNEKIRRLELLIACVRHNARLAARAEKLRSEVFQDPVACLEHYRACLQTCDKQLQDMPKAGF